MRISRLLFSLTLGMAAMGNLVADDRHDRESLERYHEAMDSIIDNAIDSTAPTSLYAAIAYSQATGKYGYSYDYSSRGAAMRRALAQCKQPDAQVVGWAQDGYCALATGKDHAYGAGHGSTPAKARAAALIACRKHSDECHIVVCVFSGSARE